MLVSSYWYTRSSFSVKSSSRIFVFYHLACSPFLLFVCSVLLRYNLFWEELPLWHITIITHSETSCHCNWYLDAAAGRSHLHIITLTDMIMNVVGLMQAESLSRDRWLFELYSISNILSQEERVFRHSHTCIALTRPTSLL